MNIFDILYTIIIGPLKLLFEVIFTVFYYLTNSPSISIIVLSLTINILLLPLYKRADKIQEEENNEEKELKEGVDHIKKTFKGDERYMILQTYYRQNNYKQTDALKGLLPLCLEIPFFTAAYSFLSNLTILKDTSFGPIADLSAPDALLTIGAISINLLPILMTIINIISSFIYTKDAPIKTKIQLLLMALVFLVLLYNSPSGLVFYWTLNNVFSLVKNILSKTKKSKYIVGFGCITCSLLILSYTIINKSSFSIFQRVFLYFVSFIFLIIIVYLFRKDKKNILYEKNNGMIFLCCILLTLVVGLLIPTQVIKSSPVEFVDSNTLENPLNYVLNTVLLSFGTFIVWINIYYLLSNDNVKRISNILFPLSTFYAIVNYLFFGTNFGTLSGRLIYDNYPTFTTKDYLINIGVLIVIIVLVLLITKKKKQLLNILLISGIVVTCIISILNIRNIVPEVNKATIQIKELNSDISLDLDTKGKNVIVLMLDRALSKYVPYIFNEKPELLDEFSGFIYYPNTISYGANTKEGSPALYGGYDYTPYELEKRSNDRRVDKHNEALKVMPSIFNDNDFKVTVTDPAFANYQKIPDLSIYDDIENIKAYNTIGAFYYGHDDFYMYGLDVLSRNFFCYSICKIAPCFIHSFLYNDGYYNNIKLLSSISKETDSLSVAHAYDFNESFIKSYSVLENLSNITNINSNGDNNFLLMCNETTHEVMLLEEPDYIPKLEVNNTEYDKNNLQKRSITNETITIDTKFQIQSYQINMATFLKLGEWFECLKENDVYDNTRIILVSDHGTDLPIFEDYQDGEGFSSNYFNALLMVKDFNCSEALKIDESFMTNADTPSLAIKDLIEDAINPFTSNRINNDYKKNPQYINACCDGDDYLYNVKVWYTVKDNISDIENWNTIINP